MRNIVWKFALIVGILLICGTAITFKDLRLGKDLRGGVSLVYKVNLPEGTANPQQVIARTITVLKDRVNPSGVYDISFQAVGRDRIEVVMPLPSKEVRALQKALEEALTELLVQSEIKASVLDDALQRGRAPAELGPDAETERGTLIADLQFAYARMLRLRGDLEAMRTNPEATEEEKLELAFDVAAEERIYERLRRETLDLSLGESRVKRLLSLPTTPQNELDEDKRPIIENGEPVMGPSQREVALTGLRSSYPHLEALINTTVEHFDAYENKRTGFDDPEDLKRLMAGAGVLQFHIAVESSKAANEGLDIDKLREELESDGPKNISDTRVAWFPINDLDQWYEKPEDFDALQADPIGYFANRPDLVASRTGGQYFLLLWTKPQMCMTHDQGTDWSLEQAYPTSDQLGRPAVSFVLNNAGGVLMGHLTASHLQRPMAIVLDGEIYSAPNINDQITTHGIITGSFTPDEVQYLIKVLAAGALSAQLDPEPISTSILGPSLGADNLNKGTEAFIIALIAVAAFMVFYYFFAGFVAVLGLLANGIIIFGVMMGIDGTFTLPGMAGIVLTIGMAVDANVLIYERIREEIFAGDLDMRGAIRQGYNKALSTILDANITNLIVCFVLAKTGTTEIKGFALTLGIGIVATLFTALFVTRQFYFLYTDLLKIKKLPMLATVVPAIHRALEPSINWISFRRVFWVMSIGAVVTSIALVSSRGVEMLDTEFRGGVAVTFLTTPIGEPAEGEREPPRLMLPQTDVESRLRALSEIEPDPNAPDAATATKTFNDAKDIFDDADLALSEAIAKNTDPAAIDALQVRVDEAEAVMDAARVPLAAALRVAVLQQVQNAVILTQGDTETDAAGNTVASRYLVKVASPSGIDDNTTITDVIVTAIVAEFGDQLDVIAPLAFDGSNRDDGTLYMQPIEDVELGKNIGIPSLTMRVPDFVGGVAIMLRDLEPSVTTDDLTARIDRMRNQPDFVEYSARDVKVFGITPTEDGTGYRDVVVLVHDEFRSYVLMDDPSVWWRDVAGAEWRLVRRALTQPPSLEGVSSFSSAVAETLSAQAIVAGVLTLLGILVYIWIRFGSLRYSMAAIVALMHDVTIALGLLALSGYVGTTAFGAGLLIEPFRIDLGVVAALLTIIGYSLNDTIVILDRVRENRGKLPLPTAAIVNTSINQTISRTLLTSFTTLMAVGIMYAEGGSGIRPFTFCLLAGIIVGSYSSVAIAAPLVYSRGSESGTQAHGAKPRSALA